MLVTAQGNLGTYEDRIAVEDVMARYVWAVDSLDADGDAAVFTEDAVIDSNGASARDGTNRFAHLSRASSSGATTTRRWKSRGANLYHVISSPRITFPKPGEAGAPVVLADDASRHGWQDDRPPRWAAPKTGSSSAMAGG